LFPVDEILLAWYRERVKFHGEGHPRITNQRIDDIEAYPLQASENATYAKHLTLNLSTLSPSISGPNSVKLSTPASILAEKNIPIQKAYLVSCTNSRLSDLTAAADVVRGKKIAEGVEFYVAAASSEVQKQAEETGAWGALVEAGARTLPAGCGPCIGLGTGLLEEGEIGISATNRNFKVRCLASGVDDRDEWGRLKLRRIWLLRPLSLRLLLLGKSCHRSMSRKKLPNAQSNYLPANPPLPPHLQPSIFSRASPKQ